MYYASVMTETAFQTFSFYSNQFISKKGKNTVIYQETNKLLAQIHIYKFNTHWLNCIDFRTWFKQNHVLAQKPGHVNYA